MIRTRQYRSTPTVDGDGHTVTVCLVPWGTEAKVTDNGRDFYRESFERGGLRPDGDRVLGEVEHGGRTVARAINIEDRADGLYAVTTVSRSAAGRDLVADIEAGIVEAVSVEFDDDPLPVAPGGHVRRSNAVLRRFAFTQSPQHPGARVVGQRSTPTEEDSTVMTEQHTRSIDEPTDTPETPTDTPETPTDPDPFVRSTPRQAPAPRPGGARSGPRFRSLGHYVHAVACGEIEGDELARYQRALEAGATTDATGLVHEEWIREIVDLQSYMQPTLTAFSSRPLPESGNTVSQPVVTVAANRPIVAKQSAEAAAIASQKLVVGKATWTVDTFAGGQNMSLQLIRRSDPSYLEETTRLHLAEMREAENANAVTVLEAIDYATNGTKVDIGNYATTPSLLNTDIVEVAAGMLTSMKRFPEVVLLSTSVWQDLANALDSEGRPLYPSISPTNPVGSLSLTTPTGAIRDLAFAVEPELTADHIIVGVRDAFRSMFGPVMTLSAEVVSTLGLDVAVAQFGAMGATDERGLWEISPAA
jgi:HK97 family phage major capsid protein